LSPRSAASFALLLSAVGCRSEPLRGGTAVGNPSIFSARVAPPEAVTVDAARIAVATLTATPCGGQAQTLVEAGPVDLLAAQTWSVGGALCAIDLQPAAPLELSGGSGDARVQLALTLPRVQRGLSAAPTGALVFELGAPGWTSAAALGLSAGAVVQIDAADPRHDGLVDALIRLSAVYEDRDEDGEVDDDEREAGGVDDHDNDDDDEDDDDDGDDGADDGGADGTDGADDTGDDDTGSDDTGD